MSDNLRVLHVIPSVSPLRGGPSKAVIEMVAALRQSGVNAEIATTNDHGAGLLDIELNQIIEHKGVPIRFFKRFSPPAVALREFAYSWAFQRWLKKNISDYDVVHIHAIFSFCSSYAMLLARRRDIPYVVRPIGQLERWSLAQSSLRKLRYLNLIERENLLNANCVHFTAHSEQVQALEEIPQLRNQVLPLGLNVPLPIRQASRKMRERWDIERGAPVIAFMSRLHPKKGLELLLDALAVVDDFPFQLIIAGEGEPAYKNTLKAKINELGLENRAHFVGFVQSAEKNLLLQGADLFALTSHAENFGIAVLEALASGTSVLVSSSVALSEQVAEHKLGYVTELSVSAIRRGLIDALSDIDTTQERGRKAREFVEHHYQWSSIAHQLTKLYKNL